ncbi:MAG: hypothetical protein U0V75_12840 [Ferruginibacter sp.]
MKPLSFQGILQTVSADIEKAFPFFHAPNAPAIFKFIREQSRQSIMVPIEETLTKTHDGLWKKSVSSYF